MEQVYVVPRDELFAGSGTPHGCWPLNGTILDRIYRCGFFAPRDKVEEDPQLKQIIPYAVVVRSDEIFLFQRSHKGGERRLYGKRSVGVGGHVNPPDGDDVVQHALRRELNEELHLESPWRAELKGLLNDDSTAVGSVHLGVVAVVDPGPGVVEVREKDTMSGSFVSRADLAELHAQKRQGFENWSALLLDRLDEVLAWPTPAYSSPLPTPTPTSTT